MTTATKHIADTVTRLTTTLSRLDADTIDRILTRLNDAKRGYPGGSDSIGAGRSDRTATLATTPTRDRAAVDLADLTLGRPRLAAHHHPRPHPRQLRHTQHRPLLRRMPQDEHAHTHRRRPLPRPLPIPRRRPPRQPRPRHAHRHHPGAPARPADYRPADRSQPDPHPRQRRTRHRQARQLAATEAQEVVRVRDTYHRAWYIYHHH